MAIPYKSTDDDSFKDYHLEAFKGHLLLVHHPLGVRIGIKTPEKKFQFGKSTKTATTRSESSTLQEKPLMKPLMKDTSGMKKKH